MTREVAHIGVERAAVRIRARGAEQTQPPVLRAMPGALFACFTSLTSFTGTNVTTALQVRADVVSRRSFSVLRALPDAHALYSLY